MLIPLPSHPSATNAIPTTSANGNIGQHNRQIPAGVAPPPASPLAIEAAARRGLDIAAHRSRPLAAGDLVRFAHPLAMAEGHLAALRALAPPGLAGRPRLLLSHDVADPYGGTARDYERALDLIEEGCARWLKQSRLH